ncbi:hypothetical protein WR25_12122 [Diploscapter pachys]|uniref:Uncharacterized protein n=1 Tax=Diploscapter pachys TaxID=2018661 RepID=A0A2A2JXN0_9BILA|nr:hypothetical protein WR25_12122 [Diploscapter pachys]
MHRPRSLLNLRRLGQIQRCQQRLVAALRFRQHALCVGLDVVPLRARRGELRGLDLVEVGVGRGEHVIRAALARDRRDADVGAGHRSRSGGRNGLRQHRNRRQGEQRSDNRNLHRGPPLVLSGIDRNQPAER